MYTVDGACPEVFDICAELWGFPHAKEQLYITEDGHLAWTVGKIIGGSYAPTSGRLPYLLYGERRTYLFDRAGNPVDAHPETDP